MEFDFDYDYDYDDDHFDYGDDYEDGGWDDDHGIYNSDDDDYQPQVGDEADAVQQIDEEQIVEEQIEEEEEEVEGDEQYDGEDEVVLVDEQYDDEDELAQDYEGEEEGEHGDLEEEGVEDEEHELEQEEDGEESEEHHEEEDEDVDDVEGEVEPWNWGNGVEEEEEEEEEEDDDDDDVDDDYDDDDEYGLQDYIPFTSTIRGSSNPVLSMPNVYEERLQHQPPPPPPPPEQPPQQQQQERVERRETVAIPQITENAVGVDERRVEENDQSRREEGESASSSMKGIESEGISKRGESSGTVADGGCCSICMEPWASEGDHQVSCLPCGHVYGLSCIKTWVQRSTYSKCPQCNRQCRLEDIITLYVSRLAVSDGEQQKKILSLQAENEFLKMKSKEEWEELNRIIGKMNTDHEEKNKRLSEQIDEMRKLIKRICDEGLKRLDE